MNTDNFRTIDLDKLNDFSEINIDNLIFSEEARIFSNSIIAAKENNTASCFFIHGSRGAGKSTFLKAVANHLVKGSAPAFLHLLDIDPTRLGKNEHFFVYVISRVLKFIGNKEFENIRKEHHSADECNEYCRKIRRCISFMTEGLMALNSPFSDSSEILDATVMLETGLARCMSSAELHEYFGEMMETLSRLHGEKRFLVTIDDSDMNLDKCYEIIECIRKYMLDKHLVFLFAGDLKLYSMVIRGHQMNHFTMAAWQYDTPNTETRLQMLTLIGSQYMLKMFPVANRLHLPNLEELLSDGGCTYKVCWKQEQERQVSTIKDALDDILRAAIGEDLIPLWKTVLYSFPLRSFLQMLKHFVKRVLDHDTTCAIRGKAAAESVMHTFSSVLLSEGIDYASIHNGKMSTLLSTVIRYECHPKTAGFLEKGYSTQFTYIEQLCSLYLNAEIARQTVTLSRKLLWFGSLYPCLYARKIAGDTVTPMMPETIPQNGGYNDSLKAFFNKEPTIYAQWGADITAMMVCYKNSSGYPFHAVQLLPQSIGTLIFADNIVTEQALVYETALRNSISTLSYGVEKGYYLSVFNLVALMINCLEIAQNSESRENKQNRLYSVIFSSTLPANSRYIEKEGVNTREPSDASSSLSIRKQKITIETERELENKRLRSNLHERVFQWAEKWTRKQNFTHAHDYTAIWEQYLAHAREYEQPLSNGYHNRNISEAIKGVQRFIEEVRIFGNILTQFNMADLEYSFLIREKSPILTFPLIEDLLQMAGKEEQYFSQYEKYLS